MVSPSYGLYSGSEGIAGIILGIFGIVIYFDCFALLRAAVAKTDEQLAPVGSAVHKIGKVDIVGKQSVLLIDTQTNGLFYHINIGYFHSGDNPGNVEVLCQNPV